MHNDILAFSCWAFAFTVSKHTYSINMIRKTCTHGLSMW